MNYKLLIIDSRIKDINIITESLNEFTKYIILDYNNDTLQSLLNKINNLNIYSFDRIGIIKEEYFDYFYKLIETQSIKPHLKNITILDPLLTTWEEIIYFFNYLIKKFSVTEIDFIS